MRIKIFLSAILFLCLAASFKAQSQEEKYPYTVLIRVYEPMVSMQANLVEAKIVIIKPDNEIEIKELEGSLRLIDKNSEFDKNMKKVRIELQIWQNQGFQLTGMSSASPVPGLMVSTFILQKN